MNRSDVPLRACGLEWSELTPAGRDRWCASCGHEVLDLSARTRREARRALREAKEPCVAYRTDDAGNLRFRSSRPRRWLARVAVGVLSAVPWPAPAADAFVGTGAVAPVSASERRVDFGQAVAVQGLDHPHRFPHGPHGPSWIAVGAGARGAAWKRVVLVCDGLRERSAMLSRGYTRFDSLPEGEACELRFRGNEPALDVRITTGSSEEGEWRSVRGRDPGEEGAP